MGRCYPSIHKLPTDILSMDIDYYKKVNGDFCRRIGVIYCADRLHALGLVPRCIMGSFWERDIPTLEKFCEENPEYHIITHVKALHKINRYVKGGLNYSLGDGDDNPILSQKLPPEAMEQLCAETYEIIRSLKPEL